MRLFRVKGDWMGKSLFLALCLTAGVCAVGRGSDYTVTSQGDDGAGTLREGVETVLDGNSIGFTPGLSIALTTGPIELNNTGLAIVGDAGGLDIPGLIRDLVTRELSAAAPGAAAINAFVHDQIVSQAPAMTSITSNAGGVFTWRLGEGNKQSLENLHIHDLTVEATGTDWAVGAAAGGDYVKFLTSDSDPEYGATVSAELGTSSGLVVDNLSVKSELHVAGGAIGVRANTSSSSPVNPSLLLGKVGQISNSVFTDIAVEAAGNVYGGVIGAFSSHPSSNHGPAGPTMDAQIEGVDNSVFNNISVATTGADGDVYGGVLGLYAYSLDGCPVQATIGGVSDTLFSNVEVITGGDGADVHGGVIGLRFYPTYSNSGYLDRSKGEIGPIDNSVFTGISITTNGAGSNIYGGGVSTSSESRNAQGTVTGNLGDITGSVFSEIHADARQDNAFGGALYSAGLTDELVISGSSFLNNSVSGGIARGGAIFIDTNAGIRANHVNRLKLRANAGETTLLAGNKAGDQFNAIHFGRTDPAFASVADAALTISTEAGGTVALHDPLSVDMTNGRNFRMTVEGGGDFVWGGVNDIDAGGGASALFGSGSRTTLRNDFQLNNFGASSLVPNNGSLAVTFDPGSEILVDLDGRPRGDALPMFANRAGNDRSQYEIQGVADVVPLLLTLDETEARWLVVDSNEVTASGENFNLRPHATYNVEILTEAGKVYIAVRGPGGGSLSANDNPNVVRGYLSGALEDAWQRYKADHPGDVAHLAAMFDELRANPQKQIAEGIVSGVHEAFRYMHNLADKAARLDGTACPPEDDGKKLRIWQSGYYDRNNQLEEERYEDYDSHRLGQVLGLSYDMAPSMRLRGYAGAARGNLTSEQLSSKTETDSYAGGLSLVWNPIPCAALELDGGVAYFDNRFSRKNILGNHKTRYGQKLWQVGMKGSRTFVMPEGGRLSPFGGMRFQRLVQDAVIESGGAWFSNRLAGLDARTLYSELGLSWSRDVLLSNGVMLTSEVTSSWRHDFGTRRIGTDGYFSGSPQHFQVCGPERALDSFDLDLEMRARVFQSDSATVDIDGGYTLHWEDRYAGHNWYAGVLVSY